MNNPPITVMTCTYNGAKFLPRCYASLLSQRFEHWEWLVVDDGSTDGSAPILASIAEADPRVRIVQNERNRGRAYSRSRALDEASGDWIALWDVDDFFFPDRLGAIAEAAKEGYDYWVSRAVQTTLELRLLGIQDFDHPFPGLDVRTGLHGAMAFKTSLGREIGYQPNLTTYGGMGEDAAIVFTCALKHKGKLEERPMMVNVTGNEVVLAKSMAARDIVIQTLERLWRDGSLPLSEQTIEALLGRMRRRNRALGMLKVWPGLYPKLMSWRMRGDSAVNIELEPWRATFLRSIGEHYPARGHDVVPAVGAALLREG
ncbi:MAG: glycosyltransferase family 2 protein [Phycisphaerales bacterium]